MPDTGCIELETRILCQFDSNSITHKKREITKHEICFRGKSVLIQMNETAEKNVNQRENINRRYDHV